MHKNRLEIPIGDNTVQIVRIASHTPTLTEIAIEDKTSCADNIIMFNVTNNIKANSIVRQLAVTGRWSSLHKPLIVSVTQAEPITAIHLPHDCESITVIEAVVYNNTTGQRKIEQLYIASN